MTHNFISTVVVEKLELSVTHTESYDVTMGSGMSAEVKGIYCEVPLQLYGIEVMEEFLPLRMGSSDVILGMQWL